jgi:ATP-dependent exoDNAse (exonuclease V) alpha subunit
MADLVGVPEEAVRAFSTRRQSLLDHMEALGTDGFAASRVAALATREAKEQIDLPRLRDQWLARAAEHGLGKPELERLVRQRPLTSAPIVPELLASAVLALTAKQTAFSMPELVRTVADSLREGAPVEQVLETAEELSRLPGVELVEADDVPGRPARFTTRELLQVEHETLELALAGRDVGAPAADRRLLARMLLDSAAGLSGEQRMLVHQASTRPDRVVCVVGAAGAGKTTALRLLADAHRESGVPVLGAAPTGRAADELTAGAGITTRTMHRLLLDAQTEDGLPHGCVLVVDEAGMAETRVLAPLLELVEQAEGKAVLVGDPQQLPPVGAGGLFPALCDRLGAINLTENRRQHDPFERRALEQLRDGDSEAYLTHAARRGRLHVEEEATVAKRRLLGDWWQTAEHDLAGTVMLAHRRTDVRDLNDAARTLLGQAGRLGPDALEVGGREFRVGDRVLCRRNDEQLGVRNGIRATVVDVGSQALTLRTDGGALRSLDERYVAEHLEHGYALTGHAAQGATLDRTFVLLHDQGALHEWSYVACTRARAETRLYLTGETLESEAHGREPDRPDPPARIARALATSAAEPLAVDQTRAAAAARVRDARRQQLEQDRAHAAQRLVEAEMKLGRLGWRGRRKHGAQLQAAIDRQRHTLHVADKKLAQLPPLEPIQPAACMPLERERVRQLRLQRETLRHARARRPERGLEIEL